MKKFNYYVLVWVARLAVFDILKKKIIGKDETVELSGNQVFNKTMDLI